MPDLLQLSTVQAGTGTVVVDGETLVGIVVDTGYVFSSSHDTAADVTAHEVTPASMESRLTGLAAVTLRSGAVGWLVTITGTTAVDLSDVDDRGGIVWCRPGATDADRAVIGFAADIGPADGAYLPTWPSGLFVDGIELFDQLGGLGDVTITLPTAAQAIIYDPADGKWKNGSSAATPAADIPVDIDHRVDVTVDANGLLTHHGFIFTPGTITTEKHGIAVLPHPELVAESERVTGKSGDGAPSSPIVWGDETPLAGTWLVIDPAVIDYLAGLPDATTITFDAELTVNGTPYPLSVDDSFNFTSDTLGEVVRFLDALWGSVAGMSSTAAAWADSGFTAPLGLVADTAGGLTIELTDSGTGDATISTGLEAMVVTPGYDQTVYGAADGIDGGLDADEWFDPAVTRFVGCDTHNHPNGMIAHQRTVVLAPVHAAHNGGLAKWTAVKWPTRVEFIPKTVKTPAMWAGGAVANEDDFIERLAAAVYGLLGHEFPTL